MTDPTVQMMSTDSHEELYRVLLETADETPVEVVANCIEILSVVLNKRLHDMAMGRITDDAYDHTVCEHGYFEGECGQCG